MPIITVNNLSYTYPDGTAALTDLSCALHEGEVTGIAGSNGAGKTTLLNHLCGYQLPQSGSITVDDIAVSKKTIDDLRRKVGVIFQNTDDQLFMSRVIDDVAFGLRTSGLSETEARNQAMATLKELELDHLSEKPPFHLSQGQKRFVAFAGILVMQPKIIIMDEPTSDLDPRHRRMLCSFVKSLNSATRIIVSHDLDFLWFTCDRIILMNEGRIVHDGECREVLSDEPLLVKHGLELPLRLQKD